MHDARDWRVAAPPLNRRVMLQMLRRSPFVVALVVASTLSSPRVALAHGASAPFGYAHFDTAVAAPSRVYATTAASMPQARTSTKSRAAAKKKSSAARKKTPTKRVVRKPAAPPPLRYTTPRDGAELMSDLRTLLGSRTTSGSWGAIVVSLTRGDTLLSANPDVPMLPASTMKLFTTGVALDQLGPSHTFSTDVLRDGALDPDGTVHGNLILRGDGDPALSSKFVRGGADGPMALVAQLARGAGVRRVTGDIIADASAFEARRIPEGWLTRYAGAAYAAPFSALSLNENIVIVGVTPSNGRATIALEPSTRALSISNTVRVVGGTAARLSISLSGENLVVVSGTIGARAGTKRYQLVVSDPALFTAGALRAALEEQGITIDGRVIAGRTPPTATLLTSLPSPPLSRLVSTMNRESINVYAEMLWRGAARGADRTDVGSTENASRTLQEFLTKRVGVATGAVTATDGSGLSVLDRVTARSLVQLLSHAHSASWGSAFHASLPVAGESELLRRRMRDTPAQGNLHAKTGTTNEVIGLSGYVTAENGEVLAFAFLYNGLDRWHALETIDAMGPTMAGLRRVN